MKKSSNSPADQKRIGEHHQIDFGYEMIDEEQKADKVHEVFDSVAPKYDLMNDLLSFGTHRLWKRRCIREARVERGMKVLDIAPEIWRSPLPSEQERGALLRRILIMKC